MHPLMVAGNQECGSKADRIDRRTKGEAHLLAGGQGDGIAAIGDIEGGQDPDDPLLLLLLHLLFGNVMRAFCGGWLLAEVAWELELP